MPLKFTLIFASVSGTLAVALGAFGAHALKDKLEVSELTNTYQTAVQYHFYHTLALLLIGLLMDRLPAPWLTYSSISMIIGLILFSGSLYLLCLTNTRWLGAITPLGGLGFIAGWLFLLVAVIKSQL